MFWIQETDLCWRIYRAPSDECHDNPAGSVEFENDNQMWLGLDYTKPDGSKAGCAAFGPFLTADEAQEAVEKSLSS